ncbi:MAG TPA: NAD(P)-dependent oxidoreductase, partial [Candidatus Binatia bacterium]|nr:NAD(P)-dependent oxidoreductase [Candidatus Binatia bacterium]
MDFGTQRILVTGGLGWLGRGLVHALTEGLAEVDALRRPPTDLAVCVLDAASADAGLEGHVELVTGDVRDAAACARFCAGAKDGILFHTAGVIHPRRVRDFYDVNVTGTRNVLAAAAAAGVRRAVVMSSNSPCGCNPHPDHRFDETSPYRPYMHYGRSKMLMERLVDEIARASGIETVVVRAPWFYGPFQPPRQTLFFRMVRDGRAPIVGDGENLRSMTYIDSLCQGLLLAALVPAARGGVYWIADERPYTMNEIVDTVERLLEAEFGQTCTHRRMRLPRLAGDVAALADRTLQAAGLYQQKLHVLGEMNKTIACAVDRARR